LRNRLHGSGVLLRRDNRSEIAVLARITRNTSTESGFAIVHDVVELPGMTRVVIASQSISGDRSSALT